MGCGTSENAGFRFQKRCIFRQVFKATKELAWQSCIVNKVMEYVPNVGLPRQPFVPHDVSQ